jgi:hypothetical protein
MGAVAITGLIFGVLAFVLSVWMMIELKSMQRSTHQFTIFDPKKQTLESMGDVMEKSDDKKMSETYDNII